MLSVDTTITLKYSLYYMIMNKKTNCLVIRNITEKSLDFEHLFKNWLKSQTAARSTKKQKKYKVDYSYHPTNDAVGCTLT